MCLDLCAPSQPQTARCRNDHTAATAPQRANKMAALTADVRDAVRKIVAESDAETMTMRGVRVQLEDALGVVVDKKELKAFVAKLVAGDDAGEEEAKDARIVALTALGRAVKFGPTVVGLGLIPFMPLIDEPAEHVLEAAFDRAWPAWNLSAPPPEELHPLLLQRLYAARQDGGRVCKEPCGTRAGADGTTLGFQSDAHD